jgi:hypothetical protein
MTANLDNARRAYEAAKNLAEFVAEQCSDSGMILADKQRLNKLAQLGITNAATAYEAALLADEQAKLDAMGVVIGETMVVACDKDGNLAGSSFVIHRIEAVLDDGRVFVFGDRICTGLSNIRPYVAPVVKEMVLYGPCLGWTRSRYGGDTHRLTLSGITAADLDGMTGPITGTYIVEKL